MSRRVRLAWVALALGGLAGPAAGQTASPAGPPAGSPDVADASPAPAPAAMPAADADEPQAQRAGPPRERSRPREAGRRDARGTPSGAPGSTQADAGTQAPDAVPSLPPEAVTRHALGLAGRTLRFTARVGTLPLRDAAGALQAEIGTTAYTLDDAAPATRPVTFVINGGPGMASAWLQLGAIGPWRLPLAEGDGVIAASASPVAVPNDQTWLDFTDLVFLDPPGTGYARIEGGEAARKSLWSVGGDVDALAAGIRRWLARAGRMSSPKIIAGESYGGFRGPRLVRSLAQDGVGIGGLVLISPALDLGGVFSDGPFADVARLPAEAATFRERQASTASASAGAAGSGPVGSMGSAAGGSAAGGSAPPGTSAPSPGAVGSGSGAAPVASTGSAGAGGPPAGGAAAGVGVDRAALADVEAYAGGEYLTDLYAGVRDPAVLDRMAARVAALTGLDPALVRRLGGRVDAATFVREEDRAQGRIGSLYDASVTGSDPDPLAYVTRSPDPVLDALVPPVSSAMVDLYQRELGWHPDMPYVLFDRASARQWDWGGGLHPPQSVDALRTALALDPHLRVVVAHGLEDLVCPYFGDVLLLRQLPFGPDRLRLATFGGGHMFYTRDASRIGLRAEALRIVGG